MHGEARPSAPAMRDPRRRPRLALLAAGLLLLGWLMQATQFRPATLFEARSLHATARFLASFLPPATSAEFLATVLRETWRSIAIATSGLALALLLAVPLALGACAALSVSGLGTRMAPLPLALRQGARAVMVALRTVPELVWALLFVRVVGLGPAAGVLAIALTYGGLLGKVYAEILESVDAHAALSLLRNGAPRWQAFLHGLLPEATLELVSYTVYRWECAIRSSVVLGFVGAGGLGQQIDTSVKMLAGGEIATVLTVLLLLVAGADALSAALRRVLR